MNVNFRRFLRIGLPPTAAVFLLIVLWQIMVWAGGFPHYILPGPLAVAEAFAADADSLWRHAASTMTIAILGFALGSAAGLATAFLLHLLPPLRAAFAPLLILTQNTPIVVLAPLLVVWFGFGMEPKLILLVLVCFFPVAIATLDGLSRADRNMVEYMRMAGSSRWQTFAKLELPWAMPPMFSGLKVSVAYSVSGAVISEWVGAEKGLGIYLNLKRSAFQVDSMFVALFAIAGLSLALFLLIAMLERRVIRWHERRE